MSADNLAEGRAVRFTERLHVLAPDLPVATVEHLTELFRDGLAAVADAAAKAERKRLRLGGWACA